jgi:hypothetical protein
MDLGSFLESSNLESHKKEALKASREILLST